MRKIRILVVDDSVVVRRLVTDTLASDPLLEVVGVAANGRIALARIPQVNPDLITLDVEMPEMNGLETLAEIRRQYPKLPVIMFSTLTERGAATTLDALALGATDYVTKPSHVGSVGEAMQRIRSELIPKVKAFCSAAAGLERPAVLPAGREIFPRPRPGFPSPKGGRVEVVAIGVSTGGPNALAELLPTLPADFPVPVLIVQHMPPVFTKLLAERLAAKSRIRIDEGVPGDTLEPGHAWLAPGDFHMIVRREGVAVRIQTHQGPLENSCRPAVDVMFRSVADTYGAGTLAVVMTGMGQDGLRGCAGIREAGGLVLAQDEPSSVVWGMPGFVANAGLANKVLPLSQLGGEILRKTWEGRARRTAVLNSTPAA